MFDKSLDFSSDEPQPLPGTRVLQGCANLGLKGRPISAVGIWAQRSQEERSPYRTARLWLVPCCPVA